MDVISSDVEFVVYILSRLDCSTALADLHSFAVLCEKCEKRFKSTSGIQKPEVSQNPQLLIGGPVREYSSGYSPLGFLINVTSSIVIEGIGHLYCSESQESSENSLSHKIK